MKKHAYLLWTIVALVATESRVQAQIGAMPGLAGSPYAPPVRSGVSTAMPTPASVPGAMPTPLYDAEGVQPLPPLVATDAFDASQCGGITCRFGKFYLIGDALCFDRTEPFVRNISQQGTTNFARLRTTDPNFDYGEVVPRLTAGFLFCDNWAVEATVLYKDDIDAIANFGVTDDVNAVWFGQQPAASDWTGADQQNLRMASGIHSYELNVVDTVRGIQPIFGFRYMEFRDQLTVGTFDNANFSSGSIGTYNTLLGGQIGAKTNLEWSSTGVEFIGKVGYYYNDARVTTFVRDTNNTVVLRNLRRNGQNEAIAFELALTAYYRPLTWLALRGGYQCLGIVNTAMAGDQIDENPTAALNTTGFSPNAKGDIIYHGPFLGVEARF